MELRQYKFQRITINPEKCLGKALHPWAEDSGGFYPQLLKFRHDN